MRPTGVEIRLEADGLDVLFFVEAYSKKHASQFEPDFS